MTRRVLRRRTRPALAILATVGLVVSAGRPAEAVERTDGRTAIGVPTSIFLAGGASPLELAPTLVESTGGSVEGHRASPSKTGDLHAAIPSPDARTARSAGRASLLAAGWPAAPPRAPPVRPF